MAEAQEEYIKKSYQAAKQLLADSSLDRFSIIEPLVTEWGRSAELKTGLSNRIGGFWADLEGPDPYVILEPASSIQEKITLISRLCAEYLSE